MRLRCASSVGPCRTAPVPFPSHSRPTGSRSRTVCRRSSALRTVRYSFRAAAAATAPNPPAGLLFLPFQAAAIPDRLKVTRAAEWTDRQTDRQGQLGREGGREHTDRDRPTDRPKTFKRHKEAALPDAGRFLKPRGLCIASAPAA